MNKNNKIVAALVALVLLVAAGFGGWYYLDHTRSSNTDTPAPKTVETTKNITFSTDGKEVSYNGQDGKTALEVLKSLTSVDSKESAYGTMVTGIHGVKAEDSKTYWALYVNDAYASEGAGTLKTTNADKITWKLEDITQ